MTFEIVPMETWWHLEHSIVLAKTHVEQAVDIRNELLHSDADYFVALYGPRVIGFSGIKKTGINKTVYEIPWCIVHPEFRGQGLARKLTQACISIVAIRGGKAILLSTPEPRFYAGLDFKVVVELPKDVWARHLMVLVLE